MKHIGPVNTLLENFRIVLCNVNMKQFLKKKKFLSHVLLLNTSAVDA